MAADSAGIIEVGLVFGGLLGFLIWELIAVRRSLKRDAEQRIARADDEQR